MEKIRIAKAMKSKLPKNCHWKINIAKNIAIFKIFLPKICPKLDKHLPYFLSSIWQPCCNLTWTFWRFIAVLLLRNKTTPRKFRNLPLQAKDRTWANCAVALSVSEASRSRLPWWASRPFMRPWLQAYSCIRPEVRLPLDQHVLCSDYCKKIYYCLVQVVFA